MGEILILLIIAIGLSMDAFSLALGYGTMGLSNQDNFKISFFVGIFHFFMPLLGLFLGSIVIDKLHINPHFVMGVILIFISLQMFIEMQKNENKPLKIKFIYLFLFALSVSLDSFSTGIGLEAITNNYILSSSIFSIISFSFTYLGLILGKYSSLILGKYAKILGILLLSIIGIVNLCQIYT